MIPDATIIIPCIEIDSLTVKCVETCTRLCPDSEIIVVSDVPPASGIFSHLHRVEIIISGPKTIAAKRNMAAAQSAADFLAFIDSDAYPEKGWTKNAVSILCKNSELGAVGGPNLPPPDQSLTERYVGLALRSPLVSGKWTYRKVIRPARIVDDLPSCNLIVRKNLYQALGGMDEVLFTGEDMDFCSRLVLSGSKILYTPDVLVYHKNRAMGPFFLQRITYGASVPGLIRRGFHLKYLLLFLPAGFVLFLMTAPLAFFWSPWTWLYASIGCTYCTGIIAETIRHSEKASDIPGTATALLVGNLVPGIGTITKALGILPDLRNIYKNS